MKRLSGLVLIVIGTGLFVIACNVKNDSNVEMQTSSESQEVAISKVDSTSTPLPTMLELGSEGCKSCEQMKPVMASLEQDYGDKIRITFHDVRKNQEIAAQYSIRLIPTQIFLDAEGNEFFRHEGFFSREEIEKVFRDNDVEL